MWKWLRSWFVKDASRDVTREEFWRDVFSRAVEKLQEQKRQLIAENERRSAEVAWLRSMLDKLVSPQPDEEFTRRLHESGGGWKPRPKASSCGDCGGSGVLMEGVFDGRERSFPCPSCTSVMPETATCTPSNPANSQSHQPDFEVPCHRQPETVSPSDSQSVPAQMPMGFRLES